MAARGQLRVAVLSSTYFGRRCIEDGILPIKSADLVGLITTPSVVRMRSGRDNLTVATPAGFDEVVDRYGCEIEKFETRPRARDYLALFERWRPDLVAVLGWYHIIPHEALEYPRCGCVGLHASLLPKYRGMAPISWALINGETETGVSLFYLAEGVDDGDIIAQARITIGEQDDCATIYEKVTAESIGLLRHYLPPIADGSAPRNKQDEAEATVFPRRRPDDGIIDWHQPAWQVYNFVRAQTRPYPGAFTAIQGRKLLIWRTEVIEGRVPPGIKVGDSYERSGAICVCCSDGSLKLIDVQWADSDRSGDPALELRDVELGQSTPG
ncbi:MAG: methionyl-tRNA formyltransferase [Candidatus Zixiibacteriota bacterium]|nr:MAG: methionyl-tRNA formyltransferase [candidate division Zixibacteria bacterium]